MSFHTRKCPNFGFCLSWSQVSIGVAAMRAIGHFDKQGIIKDDWRIVESKLRRGPKGKYEGYGLVVLPKGKRPAPATQLPANADKIPNCWVL